MNLPNKITLIRIFMIPLFVLFFYLTVVPCNYLIAAIIYCVAASTDFIDGYIARSRHLVTNLGKFLDPIADKVLVSTAFIVMLTKPAVFELLGSWAIVVAGILVALTLARELIVSGFRMIASGQNVVLAADNLGKLKTVTQDVAIPFIIGAMSFLHLFAWQIIAYIGLVFFALSALLTVASGVNYIVKNRQVLK